MLQLQPMTDRLKVKFANRPDLKLKIRKKGTTFLSVSVQYFQLNHVSNTLQLLTQYAYYYFYYYFFLIKRGTKQNFCKHDF